MTTTTHTPSPQLPPPPSEVGVRGWLRQNLFSGPVSSIVTIAISIALVLFVINFAQWAVGGRWGAVSDNMRLFLVGRFPAEEIWRVWLTMLLLSVATGLSAGTWRSSAVRTLAIMLAAGQVTIAILVAIAGLDAVEAAEDQAAALAELAVGVGAILFNAAITLGAMYSALRRPVGRRWLVLAWVASGFMSFVLLLGLGDAFFLTPLTPGIWGGLLLTLLLTVVAMVLSFPIGVLLALGRRSRLPVVRILSTAYIEIIRGVPLITVIFMASLIFPLFLPQDIRIDNVVRAMGGLTIFTAAYIAENVRGGLQAIPRGQIEAAEAVGLRGWQVNIFIVLPQALRIVIPANVGQFISLLKDTTLVVVIALLEILGIGRAVLAQPEWQGAAFEVYLFVGAVFFVLSYTLSQASYRLEEELGVGER